MRVEGVVTAVVERTVHQYPRVQVALADSSLVEAVAGPWVPGAAAIATGDRVLVERQEFDPTRGRVVTVIR